MCYLSVRGAPAHRPNHVRRALHSFLHQASLPIAICAQSGQSRPHHSDLRTTVAAIRTRFCLNPFNRGLTIPTASDPVFRGHGTPVSIRSIVVSPFRLVNKMCELQLCSRSQSAKWRPHHSDAVLAIDCQLTFCRSQSVQSRPHHSDTAAVPRNRRFSVTIRSAMSAGLLSR